MLGFTELTALDDSQRIRDLHSEQNAASAGMEMFQTLLLAELENQDPLEPMQNQEFVSQLAQLNSLQELQDMNTNMTELLNGRSLSEAANLIGKEVLGHSAADFSEISGLVKSVYLESGEVYLKTDAGRMKMKDILEVTEPASVANNVVNPTDDDAQNEF